MPKKRYRQFRRVKLTAKVAKQIQDSLVDRTFNDHAKKCWDSTDCHHVTEGNMDVARLVESGISVGKKRGYLDVPCPYMASPNPKPEKSIQVLDCLVTRLRAFAGAEKNPRTKEAMLRCAQEVEDYAHRNIMEIMAEQVVDL